MASAKRSLLIALDACARHSKRCPTLGDLGALLGISVDKVREAFHELRDEGTISWRAIYCGTGLGKVRVVTITATGQTTTKPAYQARPTGSIKEAKAERHELDRAKTALRRFGRVVFDAEVSDGPSGHGFIKVDGKNLEPAEVLRMAHDTGCL